MGTARRSAEGRRCQHGSRRRARFRRLESLAHFLAKPSALKRMLSGVWAVALAFALVVFPPPLSLSLSLSLSLAVLLVAAALLAFPQPFLL